MIPSASITVRVQPRASRTAVTGVLNEKEQIWKIALAAPPVDGEANEALIRFFAGLFGVPRSAVSILRGEKSRNKVLRIEGISESQVQEHLLAAIAGK
jgi:uncharacterized protein